MRKIVAILGFCLVCLHSVGQIIRENDEENNITLDEVEILSWSDKSVIKKSIKNLPKKNNGSLLIGKGQLTQIIECNNKVVQLGREYGMYCTNRFNYKRESEITDNWVLNFYPFYNARSFRYEANGKDTLRTSYLNVLTGVNNKGINWMDDRISYDARNKYMFKVIRLLYLYGPIYSREYSDYIFKMIETDNVDYRFSFESSGNYPNKNPLYAKGIIEIDAQSMMLKTIEIEEMGKYRRKYDGKTTAEEAEKKKYVDYKDCMFKINSIGEIEYALIHLPWDGNNDFDLRDRVRPRPDDVSCYVTECWQSDTQDIIDKKNYKFQKMISWNRFYHMMAYGMAGKLSFSKYDKEIIDSIQWAFDVTDAERELNSRTPIEQQYKIQGNDYYSSYLEWNDNITDSILSNYSLFEGLILNPIRNEWFHNE